jgi:hypothetical protein
VRYIALTNPTRSATQGSNDCDRKWFTRLVVAGIIYTQLQELNLKYPTVSKEQHQELLNAKEILESQKEG